MEKKTSPTIKPGQSNISHNNSTAAQRQRPEIAHKQDRMKPSTVIVCYLEDGSKLVKERRLDGPRFSQRSLINNQWETINEWNDPGHVANLLVKAGYESEHLPALTLLNSL